MALDGSLYDAVSGEPNFRRLRLYTFQEAVDRLPLLIYRMKQNVLTLFTSTTPDMPNVYRFLNEQQRKEYWVLLQTDFDLCKKIASEVSILTFRTEPVDSILQRIRARVQVEFAGR